MFESRPFLERDLCKGTIVGFLKAAYLKCSIKNEDKHNCKRIVGLPGDEVLLSVLTLLCAVFIAFIGGHRRSQTTILPLAEVLGPRALLNLPVFNQQDLKDLIGTVADPDASSLAALRRMIDFLMMYHLIHNNVQHKEFLARMSFQQNKKISDKFTISCFQS
ncbi:hypothetical protein L596_007011 [Steinernema carpocapsae]|uniref:Uncharacterized protein n=1 Tax=Steinernema carpocapsae TaxID=34508 RepID=A0A4U5P7Z4_STECR|nr:hypothetical protein L596_007011 [Steinernema carpocapsae]